MTPVASPGTQELAESIRQALGYAAGASSRSAVETRLAESAGIPARQRQIFSTCAARHARAAALQEQSALQLMIAQRLMSSWR